MKAGFLVFGLVACIGFAVVFLGCCFRGQKSALPAPDFEQEKAELRALARICGVPDSRCDSLSALGLISEIKIKLDQSESYSGQTLSEQDLELLSTLVTDADEPQLLKIIRQYDDYVKKLKNHPVIILP